jgi:ribosomal-protein-alanine N-acetyltransferase
MKRTCDCVHACRTKDGEPDLIIHSDRLDLVTLTPAFLRASLDDDQVQAEMLMQLTLPPGWPDCSDLLSLRLKQLEDEPTIEPWLLRAIVPRGSGVMVGHIGFHSAPGAEYLEPYSPGAVEFGFTVFPPYRRKGYARESSCALMHWAYQCHGVTRFALTIQPDNTASQSLAASLGFVRIGSHIDEVDGLEEILEFSFSGREAN